MSKYTVMASWSDVPHLDEEAKQALLETYLPHERGARSKGQPALGSGAIYPISEEEIIVEPFLLPDHWPRVYGLDVGWNKTAAIWAAIDVESDVIYLYSEHYRGQAEPSIHADAIKARDSWIPGVVDPAADGRNQKDGVRLLDVYTQLGLHLGKADNAVDSGLFAVWQRLSSGRLKVFSSLRNWLGEFRIYRRDLKGKIVKSNDHLMDATRYLIMSGLDIAMMEPSERDDMDEYSYAQEFKSDCSDVTGY